MRRAFSTFLIIILLAVFGFAGYKLVSTLLAYKESSDFYVGLSDTFVQPNAGADPRASDAPAVQNPARPGEGVLPGGLRISVSETGGHFTTEQPPISVDFDGLLRQNPEVVGWIYSPDTVINYPVLRGDDNDKYLRRKLNGSYAYSGSIFMDAACDPKFGDDNAILYGHNMKDGSMFASLSRYREQAYFDGHPSMWLLTPERNYRIDLWSGFITKAGNWVYTIGFGGAENKAAYIDKALGQSTFQGLVKPSEADRLITLSTCSYAYDDARYVLLGVLVPMTAG